MKALKTTVCLLFALIASSCAPNDLPEYMHSSPELIQYRALYSEIKQDVLGYPSSSVPISFGEIGDDKLGLCFYFPRDRTRSFILINDKHWVSLDEQSRRELVFHELIHCDMGFNTHVDEPGHIMNSMHQHVISPEQELREFLALYK